MTVVRMQSLFTAGELHSTAFLLLDWLEGSMSVVTAVMPVGVQSLFLAFLNSPLEPRLALNSCFSCL
ncbi:hypothetical protein I79_007794 [Cricetulus griseus]|uniref:Uncharacterized protein n=1 Tax=Cricetulus griseus TaxID=10029 RepID=G3HBG6_CRIGR|nr:hypothetical protein I79_007794 [Cricetulus griseus]